MLLNYICNFFINWTYAYTEIGFWCGNNKLLFDVLLAFGEPQYVVIQDRLCTKEW